MGDIVREIHPHLLERLLPEQRPQQVDDHERDDEQHEHRGEDDAEQLAQQFPVGVFDLHPEKQLVIRGDARGEHLRVPYLRSILLRSDDRLLPFRPRCPRRQAVEPDFGNIAAVPAADHVDAVGQADAGIGLPYSVDVIRGRDGGDVAEIRLDSLAARTTGAEREEAVIASQKDAPQIRNPKVFTSRVTTDDKLLFRVKIENPHRELLRELFGIILTSVLMLLVVAFVVIYLLRTLFRQKTLEEMRMDFTHNITHELKTPIAVAYAANDALENFGAADDGARRAKYLGVIRSQLTALSEMVERILTMSREEREDFTLRRERILLAGMLGALAEKFRMQAAKPARVTVDVSPEGLTAFADRFHLSHALDNLVDNALKYSGEEVHIRISAGRDGGRVVLRVADDGIGIPRAAQAHIFDKFYRVPTGDIHNVKGFGLGLYYVGLIAAKHGGSVAVESTEGRGTTFTLIIPDDGR